MTGALVVYSAVFMRYSLAVTPKNYLLFACHFINESSQLTQGYRYINWWQYVFFFSPPFCTLAYYIIFFLILFFFFNQENWLALVSVQLRRTWKGIGGTGSSRGSKSSCDKCCAEFLLLGRLRRAYRDAYIQLWKEMIFSRSVWVDLLCM